MKEMLKDVKVKQYLGEQAMYVKELHIPLWEGEITRAGIKGNAKLMMRFRIFIPLGGGNIDYMYDYYDDNVPEERRKFYLRWDTLVDYENVDNPQIIYK